MIQNWFENALATENWWSIVPVCSSIAIVTVYICSIHSAKTAKMVLTKEEHKQATMAVNALHPPSWLNNDFKQNWFCRLDYKNSSHLEACLIDRDLQQILHANLGQTPEGLKAKQYNHEVAHNVDDVRYFKKPALGIYIGPHYQWDDATSKPTSAAMEQISSSCYSYDWDPAHPRTEAKVHQRAHNSNHSAPAWRVPSSAVVHQPNNRSRHHGTQRRAYSAPQIPSHMNRQQIANRIGHRTTSNAQQVQQRTQYQAHQQNARFNIQQSNRFANQQQPYHR
jgi:hypothetical protein